MCEVKDKWPDTLYDFAYFPNIDDKLEELAKLAEPEAWAYKYTKSEHRFPVLFNYLQQTYKRLSDEGKIVVTDDGEYACFNSGLATVHQEPIFLRFTKNNRPEQKNEWFFDKFCRKGEYDLTIFPVLPEMAEYFTDPSVLVFDPQIDFRINIEHIIDENIDRFPDPFDKMDKFQLQNYVKGAIENAKERLRRNYKTAVPQYYKGNVQMLLPLCLAKPDKADLAIVVENHGKFYRATTCLTLDMAYNNARQLAKPDRDWLQP